MTTRSSHQKNLLPFVAFSLLFVMAVGYLLYIQNTATPSAPRLIEVPNDWKTYENKTQAVSFRYPSDLIYKDISSEGGALSGSTFGFFSDKSVPQPSYGDRKGNEILVLSFYSVTSELKTRFNNSKESVSGNPILRSYTSIQILQGNKVIHLGFSDQGKTYIDQIFSTLKFTK